MLYCKADGAHSTKYALECLYQFFLVYALLSPRDSARFIWNRSVNNTGQKSANIPLDEDTKHSNNFTKQGIKNLRPNLTEGGVQWLHLSLVYKLTIPWLFLAILYWHLFKIWLTSKPLQKICSRFLIPSKKYYAKNYVHVKQ